jgi:ABC-type dipeptide/oligopeptide/nickel transport system permease component
VLEFVVHRVLHTLLVAVGVVTLVFVALRLSGDPAATMLPGDASVEMAARQKINNERTLPPTGIMLINPQSTLLDADGSLWRLF